MPKEVGFVCMCCPCLNCCLNTKCQAGTSACDAGGRFWIWALRCYDPAHARSLKQAE